MPCDRRAGVAADVLPQSALARAVERDQGAAHPRERRLLEPASARPRVPMKLEHQRDRLFRMGLEIFRIKARAAHSGKPEVQEIAGRVGWDRRRV